MGIERLKGSLISEAQAEADKIIRLAEEQARGISEAEHSKCAAMRKEAEGEVKRLVEELHSERIAWARLESKRILAESREDAIKGVLEGFFDELEGARKSPEYKKYLAKCASAALAELGTGATIHVAKGDRARLPPLKGAKVEEDLEGLGGLLGESSDGKIRMNFTLETLFESRRDEIRKQIHGMLFGGG